MPYCSNCGTEVTEDMVFCPKCGAPIKGVKPETPTEYGRERRERRRDEKAEKHEKQEHPFIVPLIGGLILIFLGVASYLQTIGYITFGGSQPPPSS